MNAAGRVVIRPQYAGAGAFSDGRAVIQTGTPQDFIDHTASGGAVIDTKGNVIFSPQRVVGTMNW